MIKRGYSFALIFIVVSLLFNIILTGAYSENEEKADESVVFKLEKEGEVEVFITFDENENKIFGIFGEDKEDIIDELGDKVRYDFGDKISANITEKDLENLE